MDFGEDKKGFRNRFIFKKNIKYFKHDSINFT